MHYGCMGVLVQIRDVDENVRDKLKAKAQQEGISLNALLKDLLAREARVPSKREMWRRLRERGNLTEVSALDILERVRAERDGRDSERLHRAIGRPSSE